MVSKKEAEDFMISQAIGKPIGGIYGNAGAEAAEQRKRSARSPRFPRDLSPSSARETDYPMDDGVDVMEFAHDGFWTQFFTGAFLAKRFDTLALKAEEAMDTRVTYLFALISAALGLVVGYSGVGHWSFWVLIYGVVGLLVPHLMLMVVVGIGRGVVGLINLIANLAYVALQIAGSLLFFAAVLGVVWLLMQ